MEQRGGLKNLFFKKKTTCWIKSEEKVLRIDKNQGKNIKKLNKKINVIQINENRNEIVNIFQNANASEMFNVFAITIRIIGQYDNIKNILDEIEKKMLPNRKLLLEILYEQQKFIYIYERKNDDACERNQVFMPHSAIKSDSNFIQILCYFKETSLADLQSSDLSPSLNVDFDLNLLYVNSINSRDEISIRIINLIEPNILSTLKNEQVHAIIESKDFRYFWTLCNVFDQNDVTKEQIDEFLKIDNNFFTHCIDKRYHEVIDILIKTQKSDFIQMKFALEHAVKKEYFDIYERIKNSKFINPITNYKYKGRITECDSILNKVTKLHYAIKNNNIDEVKSFTENSHLKVCYSIDGVSALEETINFKSFNIYAYLLSNGFHCANIDKLSNKIRKLEDNEKLEIRDQNLKLILENQKINRKIHGINCYLLNGLDSDWTRIKVSMKTLKKINELDIILKINSFDSINFIFVPSKEIENIDPTMNLTGTSSTLFELKTIIIEFCKDDSQFYGNIAREASYAATKRIFKNNFLPYYGNIESDEKYYRDLVENIKENNENFNHKEPSMENLLKNYKDEQLKQRLIALVPYFFARYFNDLGSLKTLKKNYSRLFDFYKLKVHRVYVNFLNDQVNKLNEKLELYTAIKESPFKVDLRKEKTFAEFIKSFDKKRLVIRSSVPKLTLDVICSTFEAKNSTIYLDFRKLPPVLKVLDDLLSKEIVERLVINYESITSKDLEFFDKINPNVEIIIVANILEEVQHIENFNKVVDEYEYDWKDLSKETIKYILKLDLKFQRTTLKLNESFIEETVKNVSKSTIPILCEDKGVQINSKKFFNATRFEPQNLLKNEAEISQGVFFENLQHESLIFISDDAKKGKTVLLQQCHEYLMSLYPKHWISYVNDTSSLKEFFLNEKNRDLSKLLKINPLEKLIFEEKLLKGKVILIFDELDEVFNNSKYFTNAIKWLKKIKKDKKIKILTACRSHLENEIKKELDVASYRIKALDETACFSHIVQSWENGLKKVPKECVQQFVNRILKHISTFHELNLLLKHYNPDKFDDFEDEIACITTSNIYEIIISGSVKADSYNDLECLALRVILVNQYDLFGKGSELKDFDSSIKKLLNVGLVSNYSKLEHKFTKKRIAEFTVAKFVINTLNNPENFKFIEKLADFFKTILLTKNYDFVRLILNDYVNKIEVIPPEFIKQFEKIVNFSDNFFLLSLDESLLKLCVFTLKLGRNIRERGANLIICMIQNKNLTWEKIETVFGQIEEFLGERLKDYIFQLDNNDYSLLHHVILHRPHDFLHKLRIKLVHDFEFDFIYEQLFYTTNEIKTSVFSTAITEKNLDHIKYIIPVLRCDEINYKIWKNALELSFNKEDMNIFNTIKHESFKFLTSYANDVRNTIQKYDIMIKDIVEFHKNIATCRTNEVTSFTLKYPHLKYCYGNEGISALAQCVKTENWHAYAFLRDKEFKTFNESALQEKLQNSSMGFRKKIGMANESYTLPIPDSYIYDLCSKCRYDTNTSLEDAKKIRDIFDKLDKIKELKSIMKNIASTKHTPTFFFDLKNESVGHMLPEREFNTLGLYVSGENKLFLAKDVSSEARNGTIAHEMAHCALNIVYKNYCLPYEEMDEKRKAEWKRVVNTLKSMYEADPVNTEPIIANVFKYTDKDKDHEQYLFEAEMAVRVPHILAQYQDDPEMIHILRRKYAPLFNFYDKFIEVDMDIENGTVIRELNEENGLLNDILSYKNIYEIKEKLIIRSERKKLFGVVTKLPLLMLRKIYHELLDLDPNITKFRSENVFIKSDRTHLRNFSIDYYKYKGFKRLIVQTESDQDMEVLEVLKENVEIYVVSTQEFRKDFVRNDQISWKDLNKDSQDKLLEIKFSNNDSEIKLRDLISNFGKNDNEAILKKFMTSDVLHYLIENDSKLISINNENVKCLGRNYIPRKFSRKKNKGMESVIDEFDEEGLIDDTLDEDIILISDVVGSGKTETLKEITRKLKSKYPAYWISFLTLRDNKQDYYNAKNIDGKKFMRDTILKLSSQEKFLEKHIFDFLRKNKRVIFLLDGFDEICPDSKLQVINLLKDFRKNPSYKVWITSRKHLKEDLVKEFKISAFKITPFEKSQQIAYLLNSWTDVDEENDNIFAENLITQLSGYIKGTDFFGIPLQTFFLSQIFNDKKSRRNIEENLNLVSVLTKYFEGKRKIWEERFKSQGSKNTGEKSMNFMQIHIFLALSLFFERVNMFNMHHNKEEWTIDAIQECGIITYDSEKTLSFIHRSLAEFLIANFINSFLQILSEATDEFVDLLLDVLCKPEFDVVRTFLNFMAPELEPNENRKLVKKMALKMNRNSHSNILQMQITEKSFNLCDFVLRICLGFNALDAKKVSIREFSENFSSILKESNLNENKIVELENMFKKLLKNKKYINYLLYQLIRFIPLIPLTERSHV